MRLAPNIIFFADLYKDTHWLQLPKGAHSIAAYIESRGTEFPEIDYTRFFGIQGFLLDYFEGKVVTQADIEEAAEVIGEAFTTNKYFNRRGWETIVNKYGGKLPIKIYAVKEGSKIPHKNVVVYVEGSDDPDVAWLAPWVETCLLRAKWYGTAVCTISSAVNDIQTKWNQVCGAPHNPFFLNDFGARGVSSHESAEIGGSAHLVNFLGTDTKEAIRWAKSRYVDADGYSVFASEHGSTTIYGRANEVDAYRTFLTNCDSDKICSIVPDSYDYENAVRNLLGVQCKDLILARTAPTVFRPDSGDPLVISLNTMIWLAESFGYTTNAFGYKILNPKVRVIYGDGIDLHTIDAICGNLVQNGWSVENICFGMGGKLLQGVTRDTFKDACKTCFAIVNGEEVEIYKDPVTDTMKASKRGQLKLIKVDGKYLTCKIDEYPDIPSLLELVFDNGVVTRIQKMSEIRLQQ